MKGREMASQQLKRMTLEQFLHWAERQPQGRYELVHGFPVAMAAERARHNRRKRHLVNVFAAALTRAGLPCEAMADGMAVPISKQGTREPDALVYCGPRLDDDAILVPNPVIVVEVLSPSTAGTDAWDKVDDYLAVPSIHHYLIVDPVDRRLIHHLRNGMVWDVRDVAADATLKLDPPGLSIGVAELFTEI
jgi:Uma2 family endonuclease